MGYWRDREWLKVQGMENVSEAARGNLWAEGCLTGEVAFSPGTQPTHGDLTGREHRKKKISGLSPIFRLLLVLPLADPILEASGKTILSRRNMLMAIFIILYSPTASDRLSLFKVTNIGHVVAPQKMLKEVQASSYPWGDS